MKTKHKELKPFDKVLVRWEESPGQYKPWEPGLFSRMDEDGFYKTIDGSYCLHNNILPYEGNEHLVGTTDEPEQEVKLEEGEWLMCYNYMTDLNDVNLDLGSFHNTDNNSFIVSKPYIHSFLHAIRLSDFNPNDMEETKKHILCVKNGKIVKYKG